METYQLLQLPVGHAEEIHSDRTVGRKKNKKKTPQLEVNIHGSKC